MLYLKFPNADQNIAFCSTMLCISKNNPKYFTTCLEFLEKYKDKISATNNLPDVVGEYEKPSDDANKPGQKYYFAKFQQDIH